MAKRRDLSAINLPALRSYCENNGLRFEWKNESQGHAVISNDSVEAYVWVQRMVIGVRRRGGYELSKMIYDQPNGYQFSKKLLDHLLFNGEKVTSHVTRHGIRVTRRPFKKENI